jgi:O-acetyl-ADP-ribose deacetylase (regulator of RNase III)
VKETPAPHRIAVLQADITTLEVDAIVNAANERMLGGGGVDGAIHRAAGPQLLEACRAVPETRPGVRCPTGEVRITPGFMLPSRFVIHTVGPVWRGGRSGEPELLEACHRNALALAEANGVRSIAFPAISCGVFAYPVEEAAAVAVATVSRFLEGGSTVQRVLLVAFQPAVLAAFETALTGRR